MHCWLMVRGLWGARKIQGFVRIDKIVTELWMIQKQMLVTLPQQHTGYHLLCALLLESLLIPSENAADLPNISVGTYCLGSSTLGGKVELEKQKHNVISLFSKTRGKHM